LRRTRFTRPLHVFPPRRPSTSFLHVSHVRPDPSPPHRSRLSQTNPRLLADRYRDPQRVRRGRAGRAHLHGIERVRDPGRGCRWLLAAPERELLLRYTLQSVTSLVDAQGAYVALRGVTPDTLRVASTVGQCVELDGAEIAVDASATGRVIRTGEPFLTDNILNEADAQRGLSPSGLARAAMIAPLRTS